MSTIKIPSMLSDGVSIGVSGEIIVKAYNTVSIEFKTPKNKTPNWTGEFKFNGLKSTTKEQLIWISATPNGELVSGDLKEYPETTKSFSMNKNFGGIVLDENTTYYLNLRNNTNEIAIYNPIKSNVVYYKFLRDIATNAYDVSSMQKRVSLNQLGDAVSRNGDPDKLIYARKSVNDIWYHPTKELADDNGNYINLSTCYEDEYKAIEVTSQVDRSNKAFKINKPILCVPIKTKSSDLGFYGVKALGLVPLKPTGEFADSNTMPSDWKFTVWVSDRPGGYQIKPSPGINLGNGISFDRILGTSVAEENYVLQQFYGGRRNNLNSKYREIGQNIAKSAKIYYVHMAWTSQGTPESQMWPHGFSFNYLRGYNGTYEL